MQLRDTVCEHVAHQHPAVRVFTIIDIDWHLGFNRQTESKASPNQANNKSGVYQKMS